MKHWLRSSCPHFLGRTVYVAVIVCFTTLAFAAGRPEPTGNLPITTKSPEARQLFEGALVKLENLHGPEAMQDFRRAVKMDPDFAMANILISFNSVDPTVDPAEQVAARNQANGAKDKVSPGEKLVIDWLTNSSEGKMIPAIQNMNEALAQYPNDKFLAWLSAVWVENQQEIRRAIPMFEHAIELNPDFAPPMNELSYCYARVRDFDKAFAMMKRYIALLPNESNPQDSYAEILRMAGHFNEALEHYHASLKIDPTFVFSQLGIADTYALMGDEPRARTEYAIAIQHATSRTEAVTWSLQSAMTYLRERNLGKTDAALRAAAAQAHKEDLAVPEAEAYRIMAAYQSNNDTAMTLLKKAESVLAENHPLPKSSQQQELALILRDRAILAAGSGNSALAASVLQRLRTISEVSHDQVVQIATYAATGNVLVKQRRYKEAISYLEEDNRNPISMKSLALAWQRTGDQERSDNLAKLLASWNEPTLEQALVTPAFRARLKLVQ
jgi:tetratricopeptide (TPR) repeat protein